MDQVGKRSFRNAKIGGQAQHGSVIGQILARDQDTAHDAARAVLDALDWSDEPGKAPRSSTTSSTCSARRRPAHGSRWSHHW